MFDQKAFAAEIPRASDVDLRAMRDWARGREQSADARGMGRNPKAGLLEAGRREMAMLDRMSVEERDAWAAERLAAEVK